VKDSKWVGPDPARPDGSEGTDGVDGADPSFETGADDAIARARSRALRLLARREKSKRGLGLTLRRAGFSAAVIGPVLQELEQAGMIDDRRFCRLYLGEQARLRPRSLRLLRRDLQREGIESTTIDTVCAEMLEQMDESVLVLAAARKKLRAAGSDGERLRRLLGARGFARSVIERALRELGVTKSSGTESDPNHRET
jgi:regulatory protein